MFFLGVLLFSILLTTVSPLEFVCPVPDGVQTYYHAPPRSVPVPKIDRALKHRFLLLFHRAGNPDHFHRDPHDNVTEASRRPRPSPISQALLDRIDQLCGKSAFFYSFSPRHQMAIRLLQQVFMNQSSPLDVYNLAKEELHRHEINPRVWYYALVATFISRSDLNGYYLAWAVDATPDLFVTWKVIKHAITGSSRPPHLPEVDQCETAIGVVTTNFRLPIHQSQNEIPQESLNIPSPSRAKAPQCILYKGTRGTSRTENQLWYFREDIMVNQHHWYWHQYYPQTAVRHPDRRGESFYHLHHNFIARYNAERLSNGLRREQALQLQLNGNIGPGYNADLNDRQSGKFWTPRGDNMPLSDISHETDPDFELGITMDNITAIRDVLISHISKGFLVANRSRQQGEAPMEFLLDIRNQQGMNDLGSTVEAGDETITTHPTFYHPFGIHNLAHIAVALAMDPDFRCERPTGVMADVAVTMRDTAFYKVHGFTDNLFNVYKRTLPAYRVSGGEWPLYWGGVQIQSLEVITADWNVNFLQTFWQITSFPLEEGIDGSIHDGDVNAKVCHKHLNHEPFTFRLVVDVDSCWQSVSNRGTVRIFMAPRFDYNGRRFTMEETRRLMFQLDAFPVELHKGRNIITRNSFDSSLTKPWSRSLDSMLRDPDNGGRTEYCGCGWPQHLFIPKGTPQGMKFNLFAMITNYDDDRVEDTIEDLRIPDPCNSPYLLCGVPYRKYPDARPMGYPFDRRAYSVNDGRNVRSVKSLEEYVSNVPNTKMAVVLIRHLNTYLTV